MKKRFSEEQTKVSLGEAEAGLPYKALCRRDGFSETSYYLRRSKCGGMSVPMLYATDPALTVMTHHPNTSSEHIIALVHRPRRYGAGNFYLKLRQAGGKSIMSVSSASVPSLDCR